MESRLSRKEKQVNGECRDVKSGVTDEIQGTDIEDKLDR